MSKFAFGAHGATTAGVTVTDAHFGGIYSTFYSLNDFISQSELLGVTHYRWPGGTRGETALDQNDRDGDGNSQEYLFSLTQENLFTVEGKGLSDMLAASRAQGAELSIFLPSLRYVDDLAAAEAEAHAFVSKLLQGAAGYGELPSNVIIELGNESLDGTIQSAREYGAVADAQLSGIHAAFADFPGSIAGIQIAVQIGRSAEEDRAIRAEISNDNLSLIDALIAHHLPINMTNHNKVLDATDADDLGDSRFTRSEDYVIAWEKAVAMARADASVDLDFLISAWTVGTSGQSTDIDLSFQDLGARQGRTVIDTFVQLVGAGADGAHLWGVDARPNLNMFSREEGGVIEVSHGGVAFQMMAESLSGMSLVGEYTQKIGSDGSPEEPAWVYAFENAEKYVLFVAANDIDLSHTVTIQLEGVDETRQVEVARLSSTLSDTAPLDITADEQRLYQTPVVEAFAFDISGDEFDFALSEDFEVNRLTIWKDGADHLPEFDVLGAADALFGGASANVLAASASDWGVGGTEANEKIVDARGDHYLSGGGGADEFVFKVHGGTNVILDFTAGNGADIDQIDTLILQGFSYDSAEDVMNHMTNTEAGALFSDAGTTVLLAGVFVEDLNEFNF